MEQRRLSAIMFTDMVGYSALVQEDEAKALALVDEHHALLRSTFPEFEGHEIRTVGDAFLVSFDSAVQATRCALAIQTAIHQRNESCGPEDCFQVRIGIHMGDVISHEDDVFGDGVNIAARLQPLAPPGGICCSEDVARQLHNTVDARLMRLGRVALKNINTQVVAYRVLLPWEKARRSPMQRLRAMPAWPVLRWAVPTLFFIAAAVGAWRILGTQPAYSSERIAVLPFQNLSADEDDRYFADGITEELISTLSRISGISVIARTSVERFRSGHEDTRRIARDLMVGTLLEGSVQRTRDQARITVKLVDAPTQKSIWADKYDRDVSDVFLVQSEIAQRIASELEVQLQAAEMARLSDQGSHDQEAARLYFLGRSLLNQRTPDSVQKALDSFDAAVALDPGFAQPYAGLAEGYTLMGAAGYGTISHSEAVDRAKENALEALRLDPSLAEAHNSLAYVHFRLEWDFASAEEEFQKALALKPSYAKAHEWYGLYLGLMGRTKEAITEMERALELDPLSLSVGTGLGRVLAFDGQFDRSIEQIKRTLRRDPEYAEGQFALALTYGYKGDYGRATEAMEKAVTLSGGRGIILTGLALTHAWSGRTEEAMRILAEKKAALAAGEGSPYEVALIYLGIGDLDAAFEYLEKAYQLREGLLVYLRSDPMGASIHGDPRFLALMDRVGFPR